MCCQTAVNSCHWNYAGPPRVVEARNRPRLARKGLKMKKFGFTGVIATAFAAMVVGLAAPAQADIAHHEWVHDNQQRATTGAVTSIVGNGR